MVWVPMLLNKQVTESSVMFMSIAGGEARKCGVY
jgi:hypothetical protein